MASARTQVRSGVRYFRVFDSGKHRGKHINQVDDGYLECVVNSTSESDPWRKVAADALTRRWKIKQQQSTKRNMHDILSDLKSCTRKRDLQKGRRVHANAMEIGIDTNIYVAATLVNMYAKCGSMVEARTVFDSIQEPDVVSWNNLILGYAGKGQGLVALTLFSRMKDERRCAPDSVTYVAALKACTSLAADGAEAGRGVCLERGRAIHLEVGRHMDLFVQNTLIDMYAKCGSMIEARTVFDSIQESDVVSWNALILGYANKGQGRDALGLFSRMKDERRCAPNSATYIAALKACMTLAANGDEGLCLERGRDIHLQIGCHMNHYVQNTLIDMYAKCGRMTEARAVFDGIQEPDVVSWTALILGYASAGQGLLALDLFSRMKDERRCAPNSVTYVAALMACTSMAAHGDEAGKLVCLERGREIHSEIGCHMSHFVQYTLIDMYSKCGSIVEARRVFDSIQEPHVVSWNAMILGYAGKGQGLVALNLFNRMKDGRRCAPNSVTYVAVLKACTSLASNGDDAGKQRCLEWGRKIHLEVGRHMDRFVQNTLIDMYAKCGSIVDARTVFESIQEPDVVSWTALISGYAESGQGLSALDLFSRMKGECRCAPNSVTYVAVLKACTSLAANGDDAGKQRCLEWSKELHLELGRHMDRFVQNTLIGMYAKCGSMVDARIVFNSILEPDVVSWTALILGYADNGQGLVALDLFSRMKDECRYAPDAVTYVAALKACGSVGALAIGRRFHSEISKFDARVVTCLVDFYAKCGSLEEAREVFDLHQQARDVSTWTALLAGYSSFGDTGSVFGFFEAMQDQGFRPDAVTFVCVLACCSHAGLVEKAWEYLEVMPTRYGVTPAVMHYTCMIDLLGRANKLDEAFALLRKMPCHPDAVTWATLLGACRKWMNAEIGSLAFKSLVNLDPKNASAYILMAEIYGSRGMWEEQERVLETRMKSGAWKLPGQAYVMDGLEKMVKFVAGKEDPVDVGDKLKELLKGRVEHGDVAEPYSISCIVTDDEKEKALCGHSEKHAVMYGILNTPPGEVIRVVKNMRMCNYCHQSTKMFSKLSGRVIMLRDESQFHVMENGNCSCGDYW